MAWPWDLLKYDASLLIVGQIIAHYLPELGKWAVGRISHLTYRKQMWAEYPSLQNHSRKPTEYSHTFREADCGTLWHFLAPGEPEGEQTMIA